MGYLICIWFLNTLGQAENHIILRVKKFRFKWMNYLTWNGAQISYPQTSALSLPYGQKYLKTKQGLMTLKSEVSVFVNSCQGLDKIKQKIYNKINNLVKLGCSMVTKYLKTQLYKTMKTLTLPEGQLGFSCFHSNPRTQVDNSKLSVLTVLSCS